MDCDPSTIVQMQTALPEAPPSYGESVQEGRKDAPYASKTTRQDLGRRLSVVQDERIRQLIRTHIMPSVRDHVESGLYRASFVLVERDDGLLDDPSAYSLLHFPTNEYVRVIRLEGDSTGGRFWQQPRIIYSLENTLRQELEDYGVKTVPVKAQTSIQAIPPVVSTAQGRTSFWQKRQDKAPENQLFSNADRGVDARQEVAGSTLEIRCREIRVRSETEMGLYETVGCPAIVVKLRIESP